MFANYAILNTPITKRQMVTVFYGRRQLTISHMMENIKPKDLLPFWTKFRMELMVWS